MSCPSRIASRKTILDRIRAATQTVAKKTLQMC
jgi:hypothetical protein